jgi:hypothetical protein
MPQHDIPSLVAWAKQQVEFWCEEAAASTDEGQDATAAREQAACAWTPDDDGVYHTACGHVFFFDTGTIADNKQKFCGYCGGSLVEVRGAESQDMTPVVNELLQKMQAGHGIEGPHDVEALITQLREESDRALLRCCCEALACPCVTTSSVLRNSAAALELFDRKAKGDLLPEGGK